MSDKNQEIKRRTALALEEIKKRWGTPGNEDGVTLFVSHHLKELDASYWEKVLGSSKPDPGQVLDILVLESHWSDDDEDEDGIDVFDFTLPHGVTNYMISVSFDESGQVEEVAMES